MFISFVILCIYLYNYAVTFIRCCRLCTFIFRNVKSGFYVLTSGIKAKPWRFNRLVHRMVYDLTTFICNRFKIRYLWWVSQNFKIMFMFSKLLFSTISNWIYFICSQICWLYPFPFIFIIFIHPKYRSYIWFLYRSMINLFDPNIQSLLFNSAKSNCFHIFTVHSIYIYNDYILNYSSQFIKHIVEPNHFIIYCSDHFTNYCSFDQVGSQK